MHTEHNMATLLAEKMFRNNKSPLFRQHTANRYISSEYVYTRAVLGRVLINCVVLWVEDGNDRLSRYVGKKLQCYAV